MVRITGINIPDEKRIEAALIYIYGIGFSLSRKILGEAKVNPDKRAKELTPDEISRIKDIIEKNFRVEGELKQFIRQNVGRLKNIQCYRGVRHIKRLPVRGQRTRTNSRTIRGNVRKTTISGKRKVELK